MLQVQFAGPVILNAKVDHLIELSHALETIAELLFDGELEVELVDHL